MNMNTQKAAILTLIASTLISLMIYSQLADAASATLSLNPACTRQFNVEWKADWWQHDTYTMPIDPAHHTAFVHIRNNERSQDVMVSLAGGTSQLIKPGDSAILSTSDIGELTIHYHGVAGKNASGSASVQIN